MLESEPSESVLLGLAIESPADAIAEGQSAALAASAEERGLHIQRATEVSDLKCVTELFRFTIQLSSTLRATTVPWAHSNLIYTHDRLGLSSSTRLRTAFASASFICA